MLDLNARARRRRYRRSLAREANQPSVLYDFANLLRYDLGTGAKGKGSAGLPKQRRGSDSAPAAGGTAAAGTATTAIAGNAFDVEAEQVYKKLLQLEPGHASALGELAQLAFHLRHDVGNARVLFDQVGR